MQTRTLGRTGIRVSPYCLGTMMFGASGNTDHDDCVRIIHAALDAGIDIIDTADVYSGGETERIVGAALRRLPSSRRDEVVVATKVNGPMGPGRHRSGSSRRWIVTAVDDSLRRLQLDHIDLYQLHHPDPDTDIEETLAALTDLLASGKIRAIGSSSLPATDIVEAQWVSRTRGLARLRTEQPPYSILNRGIERDVLPTCERFGLGTLAWSPLAMGLLTGRHRKGRPGDASSARMRWVPRHMTDERKLDAVEALLPLADDAGLSLTHLAMAFAVAHPGITAAIIGPRTMAQLQDLLAGAEVVLDDDVLDRIDQIVPPGVDISPLDVSYVPPPLGQAALRRRPVASRAAA